MGRVNRVDNQFFGLWASFLQLEKSPCKALVAVIYRDDSSNVSLGEIFGGRYNFL